MKTLHTFGCSITQGFALPDTIKPVLGDDGEPLTDLQVQALIDNKQVKWEDMHLYKTSQLAWPQLLADKLNIPVVNHAHRGACFQQIARQCTVAYKDIKPEDVVIVMWTYLSRLSLQWPARTSVPFCNIVDPQWGWKTVIKSFNKLFGLSPSDNSTDDADKRIQKYIEKSTKDTYLDPMGVFNRYYNSLILQQITDGFLKSTGAQVIHLSVEPESAVRQLDEAREELDASLKTPYKIPEPTKWYNIKVDHNSCDVILDPSIPTAPNDMHPSEQHHFNFAEHIHSKYFKNFDQNL